MSTKPTFGPRHHLSPDQPRRPRRWRRLVLLLLCSLVVGELLSRWWDRGTSGSGSLYDYVVTTGTRFRMRPGVVDVPERYGEVRYSFNSQGYRDRDHDQRPGRRPLLLLGDSVTFGLGTNQGSTYAAVLQRRLDAAFGPRYDVVNLALFSYDSGHELAAFREDGVRLRPAVVVTQFYMNDFDQLAVERRSAPPPAPGLGARLVGLKNLYLNRSSLYRRTRQAVLRTSYLLVHDLRRRRFPETLNDAEPRSRMAYLQQHPDDATIPAFASLLAIRDQAAAIGAPFVLLTTPDETQLFTPRFDAIDARLRRFASRHGIVLVEALPVLRRDPRPQSLFLDGLHLSAEGHRLVGDHLATRLEPLLAGDRR